MRKALAILTVALSGALTLPAQAQNFVNILTGGTGGVYYPLGVALSNIYGNNIEGVRFSVQSTQAGVENLNLLQQGRGELALVLGDVLHFAWSGNEEAGFRQPLDKLRGVAAIYTNYVHLVALEESGIRELDDLRGKRVSVGAARSGTELNMRALTEAAGLTYEDFGRVEYLGFNESVELMKNRQLDATVVAAGLGVGSIRDLANSVAIVIVPIPEEVVRAMGEDVFVAGTIPAGTYDGQTEDVPTAGAPNFVVTHDEVGEDLVYQMTKLMYENLDQLAAAHAAARGIELEQALASRPVPLHPGAERYYREVGLLQ